jgi:hypothetical protein
MAKDEFKNLGFSGEDGGEENKLGKASGGLKSTAR